jgi:hypothetical protein
MTTRDIIITGVPRSGTTLTCYLLNKVPDTIALHEPICVKRLARLDTREIMCDEVEAFIRETRQTLVESGTAKSKHVAGSVPDNPAGDACTSNGMRPNRAAKGYIRFDKPLSQNFLLCIKQPAFTVMLESLITRFPCFALVRSPLAVLASWNSVNMPVRDGHAPGPERHDRRLRRTLAKIEDRFDRQIFLLSWFYGKYSAVLQPDRVLRYEEIVQSGGRALDAIVPAAKELDEGLQNKNCNPLYDRELMQQLGERLLKADGEFWHFYSRDSVEALLTVSSH